MNRLFFANFDFEHQMGRHPKANLPALLQRHNAELATAWMGLADDGDSIWLPEEIAPDFFAGLAEAGLPVARPVTTAAQVDRPVEFYPWGWTPSLRNWAAQQQWSIDAPPHESVARANSRRTSAGLEQRWNVGLSGAVVADSRDAFIEGIAAMPHQSSRWVAKAEFGMSARERILGQGRVPSLAAVQWVDKRIKSDGVVFVEPWVEKIEEAGLQFTISHAGNIAFVGISGLLTDATGQYRGSRFTASEESISPEWITAVDTGLRTAGELQELGYFGPLGIDAVLYRDEDGNSRVRPLQDINARNTMGRVGLGFRRLLAPGEHGSWLHVRWPADTPKAASQWVEEVRARLPSGVRLIPTSPFEVGGQPTMHGMLVVIAATSSALQVAEAAVFATT